MNERAELLKKLNAYAFAAYDWNLYLDTHPTDRDGIAMFRKMADRAEELKREFESKYGPLTAEKSMDPDAWTWINDPWPWEKA